MDAWYVILLLLEGLLVGALARLVVPGRDEMPLIETMALGLLGSILGGFMAWMFVGHAFGLFFSVICAAALVYTRRRFVEHEE